MIWNLTKKTVISQKPVVANTLISRGRGMIGRKFVDFDAMIFYNCTAIHTLFMSMPIDVIFLDRSNRICEIRENLSPWNPFVRAGNSWVVIEMSAGSIKASKTEKGDIIDLNAELSDPRTAFGKNSAMGNISTAPVATYKNPE